MPGEVIEISGTKPPPSSLDIQIQNRTSDRFARNEFERQEIFQYEHQPNAFTIEQRAEYYREHPGAESAYYAGLQERFNKEWNRREADLEAGFRHTNTAAAVVNGAGWVGTAAYGVFAAAAGFQVVNSIFSSSASLSVGVRASTVAYRVPALAFTGCVIYGATAPPGSPDLPGPWDDLGRAGRGFTSFFSKALPGRGPLSGSVTQAAETVLTHLEQVLPHDFGPYSRVADLLRQNGGQMTRQIARIITRAASALPVDQRGGTPEISVAIDFLMGVGR